MAYLTDGFVADWWVREQPKGAIKAKRLVEAGLWRTAKKDGEQGWQFHDWKPECTKSHVLAAREKARQRKAKSRESQGTSRVTDHVTDAVSPPSCLVPTQPNPTQPINSGVDLSREVTQVAEPSPRCTKHENHTDPPPCHGCRKAREANEAWHAGDFERRRIAREAAARDREAAIKACRLCDEFGDITFDDSVRKCKHQEVS